MAVNPALEAQGAGVLRAAGEGYLLGYALVIGICLAGIAIEGLAATEVAAVSTGTGATGTGAALTSGQAGGVIAEGELVPAARADPAPRPDRRPGPVRLGGVPCDIGGQLPPSIHAATG